MASIVEVVVDLPVKGVDRPFDYLVPDSLKTDLAIGHQVKVPFGNRFLLGYVLHRKEESFFENMKEVHSILHPEPLFSEELVPLIQWLANYYQSYLITSIKTIFPLIVKENQLELLEIIKPEASLAPQAKKQVEILEYLKKTGDRALLKDVMDACSCKTKAPIYSLLKKGILKQVYESSYRRPFEGEIFLKKAHLPLNSSQKNSFRVISESICKGEGKTFLLHGVTGSGKTEVYLQVIQKALDDGGGAITLVPEVALTWQTVRRFKERFGDRVALLHSYLSKGERFDEWLRIKRGEAQVVIGARSAVFAPLPRPSLIIIDEEHEWSYKEGENPRYHARDVARERGLLEGGITLLGSATPDVESFYLAKEGTYQLLELKKRVLDLPMPPVRILDMRKELEGGNRTIISQYLHEAIEERLGRKEQVLLFLNRRGFSNFLLCRSCGYVPRCRDCDVSLTYHAHPEKLFCHYCNHPYSLPARCPQCGSRYLQHLGIGTQKVEEVVKEEYPQARVARMDMDTTRRKGAHVKILQDFEKRTIDILIGTQMIAKGHDLPNITLVGVILADTVLHFPDFRSSERTFQLMTQVAGRTGRGEKGGEVVIQTYSPDHYSLLAASNHDYGSFYDQEIKLRERQAYPPFSRLINMIISSEKEGLAQKTALSIGSLLKEHLGREGLDSISILGPSPASLKKIRGRYRWQIILKSSQGNLLREYNQTLLNRYTPNLPKGVDIRVDVDPISIL